MDGGRADEPCSAGVAQPVARTASLVPRAPSTPAGCGWT